MLNALTLYLEVRALFVFFPTPDYLIQTQPKKQDIETLISMIKKPLVLAGTGINHSKSNHLLHIIKFQ